jgi:hypothetical protein
VNATTATFSVPEYMNEDLKGKTLDLAITSVTGLEDVLLNVWRVEP